MLQEFYTDTLESKFIKALLHSTELPILPTVGMGEQLVEGCCYIYHNSIIKCTKKGFLSDVVDDTSGEYVILNNYNFGDKVVNITEHHTSEYNYYDSDTHYFLGQYLRCLRDIYGIDLLPFYNCFNYKIVSDIYLVSDSENCDYYSVGNDNYQKDEQNKYKVVAIPIKFDKVYTIAIDCSTQVTLKSVFYDKLGNVIASTPSGFKDALTNTLIENNGAYSIIKGSTSFRQPFTYSVSAFNHDKSVTDADIKLHERQLNLIIQLPIENTSSIVVLEGDYTSNALKIYNSEYIEDITISEFNRLLLSPLQLMQFSDGISYAFSNRLVEYLLDNVITPNDSIAENITRTQEYASSLYKTAHYEDDKKNYKYTLKGVWDKELREFLYKNYMNSRNKNIDINGFVDKNIEKYITKGR